jgi:hypothetical protein
MQHRAAAPLETTLDNFCEIEHTSTTHDLFGYPLERMHEVTTRTEADATSVRVINEGPHKALPWYARWYLGLGHDVTFVDDWTTHFSPLYTVFDHSWHDAESKRPARLRWRLYIFLTPITDDETLVTTITFVKSTFGLGPYGGVRVIKPWLRHLIDREVKLDCEILTKLADKRPQLAGMKLSRFDRALGLNRERIDEIYRGEADFDSRRDDDECDHESDDAPAAEMTTTTSREKSRSAKLPVMPPATFGESSQHLPGR